MKLVITEEDRQFIESIVQRFDPVKVAPRPSGLSDRDWNDYLAPLRLELGDNIKAAMLAKALNEAGLFPSLDSQSVGDLASGCGLDQSHVRWSEDYEALADRIREAGGFGRLERWSDHTDEVIEHVLQGAGV